MHHSKSLEELNTYITALPPTTLVDTKKDDILVLSEQSVRKLRDRELLKRAKELGISVGEMTDEMVARITGRVTTEAEQEEMIEDAPF